MVALPPAAAGSDGQAVRGGGVVVREWFSVATLHPGEELVDMRLGIRRNRGRPWLQAGGVRKVGLEHEVRGPHQLDRREGGLDLGPEASVELPLEILTRKEIIGVLEVRTGLLPLPVQCVAEVRQPPDTTLNRDELQAGVAMTDTGADHLGDNPPVAQEVGHAVRRKVGMLTVFEVSVEEVGRVTGRDVEVDGETHLFGG